MHCYRITPLKTGIIIVDQGAYVTRGIGVPVGEHLPFTVMGRFSNIVESWHSIEEIVWRGKVILPGHDTRTMDHPVYPTGTKI